MLVQCAWCDAKCLQGWSHSPEMDPCCIQDSLSITADGPGCSKLNSTALGRKKNTFGFHSFHGLCNTGEKRAAEILFLSLHRWRGKVHRREGDISPPLYPNEQDDSLSGGHWNLLGKCKFKLRSAPVMTSALGILYEERILFDGKKKN